MGQHFRAPWSTKLKITTAAFVLLLLVVAYYAKDWAPLVILAVVVAAAVLSVRGYSVLDGRLLIHHLGWASKFDLAELSTIDVSPGATMGSVRTFGIGGLFSLAGWFRNEVLGSYRAFATNELNTVVLDFAGKKIVVTPEDPHRFAEVIRAQTQ
jgi:hypothetical protein